MANAWMIRPLEPVGSITSYGGATIAGAPEYLFNDYAGVVFEKVLSNPSAPFEAGVNFEFGIDVEIDTVLIFGLDGLEIDGSIGLYAWTDANGPGGTPNYSAAGTYAGSIPLSNGKGVGLVELTNPVEARYFQLSFYGATDTTPVQASRIIIGKRIELERNFSFGAGFGVKDLGSADFTRRGVLARVFGKILRTVSLTFSSIYKDEVEAVTKPLIEEVGNTKTVALITDPAPDEQRQNRCYFGFLVGDLSHTWRTAAAWEAKINMVSIF